MPLRNSNPVKGCTIVLQIEHIDLEFNINASPFSLHATRRSPQTAGGHEERVEGEGRLSLIDGGERGMSGLSRIQREEAVLVVVDVQEALMKKMNPAVAKKVIRNIRTLISGPFLRLLDT